MCLRLSGIPFFLRLTLQRKATTILCYHDPAPDVMDMHLNILKERYNLISLREYVAWRNGQSSAPLPSYALVVTLDDGHRGNAELTPVFKKHKVMPTIFLCSAIVGTYRRFWWQAHDNYPEMVRLTRVPDYERLQQLAKAGFSEDKIYEDRRSLSREEIEALKGIVDFQSHTRFHPILPECAAGRAEEEIIGSRTELNSKFGLTTYALAYPNGDYSDREIAIAEKAGYTCALTLGSGYNTAHTPLFRLLRLPFSDFADEDELIVKASGLWSFIEKIFPKRSQGYLPVQAHTDDDQGG